jgi:hypothetical protein
MCGLVRALLDGTLRYMFVPSEAQARFDPNGQERYSISVRRPGGHDERYRLVDDDQWVNVPGRTRGLIIRQLTPLQDVHGWLALIWFAAATFAVWYCLDWAKKWPVESDPLWEWLVGALGIAVGWATLTCILAFCLLRKPLRSPASESESAIWTPSGSFLTNVAFVAAVLTAIVGEKGAFLADLSADEKMVVIVSLALFAAIAGSAGLIAQLDTATIPSSDEPAPVLTVGGLLVSAFLTLIATAGNLSIVVYMVHELGTQSATATATDKPPLEDVWVLFVILLAGAALAASAYNVVQLRTVGKSPDKRHTVLT